MIITSVIRTHNEQRNLRRFINAYNDWVDLILVQDDQSDDRTYLLTAMLDYPKVWVHWYYGKRIVRKTITRAFQHIQLNRLIERAEGLNSDWIIMDDCDSVPTKALKGYARELMEQTDKDFIYIPKLHFYKDLGYFPKMSKPGGEDWEPCLWAWRANKGFKFLDRGHKPQGFDPIARERICKLFPPYAALHYPWPDDDVIEEKRIRYTEIYGKEYSKFNPLDFGGDLEPAPEWAIE